MERKLTGEEQLKQRDLQAFDPQEDADFEDRAGVTTDALEAEREEAKELAMDTEGDSVPEKQIGMGKGSGRFEDVGIRGPKSKLSKAIAWFKGDKEADRKKWSGLD